MNDSETPIREPGSDSLPMPAARPDLSGRAIGDFRVERLLGHGGMGEVYLARQISLDRPVALKVLRPELLSNPTYLARFEKEALSAAKLNHPNVVHIYSIGSHGDLRYIAMEYVPGTNLKEFLARKGPPDLPLAMAIMRQSGQAMAAAGEFGLIHRDLKPENLLLTRKGQVKVADFGLCRSHGPGQMELTQEGVTLGTPMYMSPEQVQGRELDHRSDLYSLGVTFYHMLAGEPPHRADTPVALALKHVREQPVDLSVHRPDLPPEICRLVMRLLQKDPAARFATAGDMLRELSRIKEALHTPSVTTAALPDDLVRTPADGAAASATAPARPAAPRRSPRERLRGLRIRPRDWAAILALAAAAGALAGAQARPTDLLSPGAPEPTGPPGLWMAPWGEVPKQPSAEAQYRFALLAAPDAEREAAWLAVPGRFPTERAWAGKAYNQLARTLLRRGDVRALESLAAELPRQGGKPAESAARVVGAAAHALKGEAEELLAQLEGADFDTRDPAQNELILEAVLSLRRAGAPAKALDDRLRKLEDQLNAALQLDPLNRFLNALGG